MSSVAADIRVKGQVQGVGYRYFCYTHAIALGIVGWAKNMYDGSVSVHAEGDRSAVESFIAELQVGPRHAAVTDVEVTWVPYTGEHRSFQIAR